MVKDYSARIICSKELKRMLRDEVREEFLRHHPKMKDVVLSENYLLDQVIQFYLK